MWVSVYQESVTFTTKSYQLRKEFLLRKQFYPRRTMSDCRFQDPCIKTEPESDTTSLKIVECFSLQNATLESEREAFGYFIKSEPVSDYHGLPSPSSYEPKVEVCSVKSEPVNTYHNEDEESQIEECPNKIEADNTSDRTKQPCHVCGCNSSCKLMHDNHHKKVTIEHKPKVKTFICSYCSFNFKRKRFLESHIDAIHKKIMHSCPHCNFKNRHKSYIQCHIRVTHKKIKQSCSHCDFSSLNRNVVKKHIDVVHNKILQSCPHCTYKSVKKCTLKQHINSKHYKIIYKCPYCSYKSSDRSFQAHMKSVHGEIKCMCHHCDKNFPFKEKLRYHVEVEHLKIRYKCKYCIFAVKSKKKLSKHIKTIHEVAK